MNLPNFFTPRRQRRLALVATAVLGLGSSFAAWRLTGQIEAIRAQHAFLRRAEALASLTRAQLQIYEEMLLSLREVFLGSDDVSRDEFRRVCSHFLQRHAGIQALEWVPAVPHAARAAMEQRVARELGRPFQFMERDAADRLHPAATRAEYLPILYAEPVAGNEAILGYDITTAPTHDQLAAARRTGQSVVPAPFHLMQLPENELGVVVVLPVYWPGGDPKDEFRGFVQGVFHLRVMLAHPSSGDRDLDIVFTDPAAGGLVVFWNQAGPGALTPPASAPDAYHSTVHLVNRTWNLAIQLTSQRQREQRSPLPWLVLAGGLLTTGMAVVSLRAFLRRSEVIEREVAERTAELTESRRELDTFLHELPGMAYRATYDDTLDITYISDGAEALTGYAPAEFLSRRVHARDIIHPDDLERVRAATRAGLEAKGEIEVEHRIRTRDGREKWVLSRGGGVFTAGRPPVFEGLSIDITAQKLAEVERLALERKLLEGQKLESLGLLAGGIAHDFNNLLTGVLGNAGLARLALPTGALVEPQLRAIEQAALRAAELCRQMLAYAGKGRFLVEPVDLSALVEGVLPLLNISLARRAELRLELTRSLPAVQADATQLRQIVMNLVLNAADAIGDRGGTITLATGVMHADVAQLHACAAGAELPEGDYVFLEVRDTGCGMAPEVLAKIFDPFFTTKFAGRGLGLAAVLGIVRGHQGALRVESTAGQGSNFRLLLPPSAIRDGLPPVASAADTSWRRAGQVLVIDDETTVRTVAAEMLQTLGLTPRVTGDGRAGLAAFRENPAGCDLVMLDLVMPGLSGEQTLQALRVIRPDVRVILMSGYNEGNLLQRLANERGALAFLPKPFTRETLIEKLRALLG